MEKLSTGLLEAIEKQNKPEDHAEFHNPCIKQRVHRLIS
jgi:hypothetical protein